jgi:hypothetical protein
MPEDKKFESILQHVRTHTFQQLAFDKRAKTNLYVDERVIPSGETIGPGRQKIVTKRPSILVFADDQPDADFSHPCRYLFYDSESGSLHNEVKAQFPPYAAAKQKTFKVFHEPVKLMPLYVMHRLRPYLRCPILLPDGNRFAILFSGMSNVRHVNNLEFLYRTLVDEYAFKPSNIYVLNYDGTLNSQDGVPPSYVGDTTPFRMTITGEGTRSVFETAVDELKPQMKSHDLLFVYTGNHGGWDYTPGSADLCTYPNWDGYHASDMATKLSELPHFRNLLVMMSQCHSGGFNAPILASSTADATSVAASVSEPNSSSVSYDWNYFARDWTSSQAGHDPYNNALASNSDTNGDSSIQAEEAFDYAYANRAPGNDPIFSESSEAGGDITLGQQYIAFYWWHHIILKALERHFGPLPPEQYFKNVHAVQPQLTKLAMELDMNSNRLQEEYRAKVEKIIERQVREQESVRGIAV